MSVKNELNKTMTNSNSEQKVILKIQQLSHSKPVKKINSEKDLEDFFNED